MIKTAFLTIDNRVWAVEAEVTKEDVCIDCGVKLLDLLPRGCIGSDDGQHSWVISPDPAPTFYFLLRYFPEEDPVGLSGFPTYYRKVRIIEQLGLNQISTR